MLTFADSETDTSIYPVGSSQNPSYKVLTISNCLTFLRIILTIVFFILFINGANRDFCVALFVVTALTDFLDGAIARKTNTVSWLGKVLDPLVDRLLLFCGVIALFLVGELPLWIPILLICRDGITVVGAFVLRKFRKRPLDVFFLGKLTTVFLLTGYAWMLLNKPVMDGLGLTTVDWLPFLNSSEACPAIILVYIGVLLSCITLVMYVVKSVRIAAEVVRNKKAHESSV